MYNLDHERRSWDRLISVIYIFRTLVRPLDRTYIDILSPHGMYLPTCYNYGYTLKTPLLGGYSRDRGHLAKYAKTRDSLGSDL